MSRISRQFNRSTNEFPRSFNLEIFDNTLHRYYYESRKSRLTAAMSKLELNLLSTALAMCGELSSALTKQRRKKTLFPKNVELSRSLGAGVVGRAMMWIDLLTGERKSEIFLWN